MIGLFTQRSIDVWMTWDRTGAGDDDSDAQHTILCWLSFFFFFLSLSFSFVCSCFLVEMCDLDTRDSFE